MDSTAEIQSLFGVRVRELREARGWQLDDVGIQLGRSRASMSRIENGKQNLTMAHIASIAAVFGVPVSVLFGGTMPPVPPPTLEMIATQVQALTVKVQEVAQDAVRLTATTHALIGFTQGTPPPHEEVPSSGLKHISIQRYRLGLFPRRMPRTPYACTLAPM